VVSAADPYGRNLGFLDQKEVILSLHLSSACVRIAKFPAHKRTSG
jgi:hypothetical protein